MNLRPVKDFSKYLILVVLLVVMTYFFKILAVNSVKFPSQKTLSQLIPSEKIIPTQAIFGSIKREIGSVVDPNDDAETKAIENRPDARISIGEKYYKEQQYSLALPYFKEELKAIKTGDSVYRNQDQVVNYLQARITEINQKIDE